MWETKRGLWYQAGIKDKGINSDISINSAYIQSCAHMHTGFSVHSEAKKL